MQYSFDFPLRNQTPLRLERSGREIKNGLSQSRGVHRERIGWVGYPKKIETDRIRCQFCPKLKAPSSVLSAEWSYLTSWPWSKRRLPYRKMWLPIAHPETLPFLDGQCLRSEYDSSRHKGSQKLSSFLREQNMIRHSRLPKDILNRIPFAARYL